VVIFISTGFAISSFYIAAMLPPSTKFGLYSFNFSNLNCCSAGNIYGLKLYLRAHAEAGFNIVEKRNKTPGGRDKGTT
jgi:hypothetical protein